MGDECVVSGATLSWDALGATQERLRGDEGVAVECHRGRWYVMDHVLLEATLCASEAEAQELAAGMVLKLRLSDD